MLIKDLITSDDMVFGKNLLNEIFSMLIGFIKSNSDRGYEIKEEYITNKNLSPSDNDQDND